MAKGRRLTTSRSERHLRVGSFTNNNNGYGHVPVTGYSNGDVSEFAEEDVWSIVEHVPDYHHNHHHHEYDEGGEYGGACTPRAGVEGGGRRQGVGGLSLAFEDPTMSSRRIVHQFGNNNDNNDSIINNGGGGPRVGRHVATSAPVNVPDWSKILRVDSSELMHGDSYEDDDPDGAESGIEPPHEYLARSRKMNAFSVYEGVGRTLKGRDMSRVRDAVWSQTGFEG